VLINVGYITHSRQTSTLMTLKTVIQFYISLRKLFTM